MGKKVEIQLDVNASTLYGISDPSKGQIDSNCTISDDNNGSSPNGTLEDFTSEVYLDNDVKWKGKSLEDDYSVSIDSIVYESKDGDVNFFNDNTIEGSGGHDGTVMSKVKNDNSLKGKVDDYTINFSIWYKKANPKTFPIDPKLQIKQ